MIISSLLNYMPGLVLFLFILECDSFLLCRRPGKSLCLRQLQKTAGADSMVVDDFSVALKGKGKQLNEKLRGTSIYLLGVMGSGKSTVGELLAKVVDYKHLDTDELAEYMMEQTIAETFMAGNEELFRDVESKVLGVVSQHLGVVISTGGGIVLKTENWGLLRHGIVVFLDVDPTIISKRMLPSEVEKRPLLKGKNTSDTLKDLRGNRIDLYMQSDVQIEIGEDISVISTVEKIVDSVSDFINSNPPLWQRWKEQKSNTV